MESDDTKRLFMRAAPLQFAGQPKMPDVNEIHERLADILGPKTEDDQDNPK
jgi:hypothetical protein